MSLYIQDYDEQYPPATDWAGAIQPHVRSAEPFKCPSVQSGASYAMNAALSRRTTYELPDPMNTVLLFDAKAPAESFAGGKELLALERHGKVPNIAFTDGSVKRATPGYQQTFTWTPAWLPTKNKPRP